MEKRSACVECGKRGVWKTRSVENQECGKLRVWKIRSVLEDTVCGKCSLKDMVCNTLSWPLRIYSLFWIFAWRCVASLTYLKKWKIACNNSLSKNKGDKRADVNIQIREHYPILSVSISGLQTETSTDKKGRQIKVVIVFWIQFLGNLTDLNLFSRDLLVYDDASETRTRRWFFSQEENKIAFLDYPDVLNSCFAAYRMRPNENQLYLIASILFTCTYVWKH